MRNLTIKKVFGLGLFTSLVLSLGACGDFLKEESRDEVIPKTVTDFKELLMGSGYMRNEEPSNFIYFLDDDVEFNMLSETFPGSNEAQSYMPTFTWQPFFVDRNGVGVDIATSPGSTAYARYYNWIMGCNAVLDNIDKAIGTDQERNRVKAEALAVRATYYFRLANLYGDPYNANPNGLAVPLKLHSGIEETYSKRATVKEVYALVVGDLEEALRLMEPLDIIRGDYHINQRAIHILLSRIYLYTEEWEKSVKHADLVFEKGGKVAMLTTWSAENNVYLTYDNPEVEWVFGGNPQANQTGYMPSMYLYSTFDPKDIRLSYFSVSENGNYSFLVSKLLVSTTLTQVLRSSEALLNRAEAYAQLKNVGAAAADLNLLRRSRIPNYKDQNFADAGLLLESVRDERRREFCFEGFRWFDLRRYGRPAIEHRYQGQLGGPILTYTLEKNDPMYTLPFPNTLTSNNPQLVQNPSVAMGDRFGK